MRPDFPTPSSSSTDSSSLLASFSATVGPDATELTIQPIHSSPGRFKEPAVAVGEHRAATDGRCPHDPVPREGVRTRVARFWRRNVSVVVPGASARDHLALERTFLAYQRTSLALCLLSVVVAQLNVLLHVPKPDPVFGYHVLGKPLAVALLLCAILISLLGLARWWRWQQVLLRGRAVSGGWELMMVGLLMFFLLVAIFALGLAVQVRKLRAG